MSVFSGRADPAVRLSVPFPARDMRAFLVPDHKPNEQKGKMIFHYDTGPKSVNNRVFGNSVRAFRIFEIHSASCGDYLSIFLAFSELFSWGLDP